MTPKTTRVDIPAELRQRLERLAPLIRIRVKRGNTNRAARLTELVVLASEHLVADMEAGDDVLGNSRSFAGAVQLDAEGDEIARAPLTSAKVYAQLMAEPGVPTPEQIAALDADAALLREDDSVRVRGSVFHTAADLVGERGEVMKAQRGRTGPLVLIAGETIEINPYDLVPASLYGEHQGAVDDFEGGGA